MPGRVAFLRAPGSANDHDLGLFALGAQAPGRSRAGVGLYHLAWEVGSLGELAETARRLNERGALVGASDHGTAKSLYAKDSDGNEFEMMWRAPRDAWPTAGAAAPRPLDLMAELARWGGDLKTGAAAGSVT